MINPAVLCVPAIIASQNIRRQQATDRLERVDCSYPILDSEARKLYVDYYINELIEAGFEVHTCPDVIDDHIIIQVRKGDIGYRASIDNAYFMDDFCLTHEIRQLVNRVENEFNRLKGE